MSCCQAPHKNPQSAQPSVGAQVVAAVLASNSMAVALATNLNPLTPAQRFWAHMLLLGFALINLIVLGRALLTAAWDQGFRSVAGLFVLGIFGALSFSLMSTLRGTGPVYYEIVSILLVIYTVGRALTHMAQKRVQQQLSQVTLHGTVYPVRRGDGPFVDMPVEAIEPNDAFMVRPGGVIVVDGEVTGGAAYVQTASSTGESQLRRVTTGDQVLASWYCTDATLLIRATTSGTKRGIDAVAWDVTRAQGQRTHYPSQSERVAAVFAPLVVSASIATFVVWAWLGHWDAAILNALAVCLVACPCAFGFAAPIGLRAGAMRLAAAGIVLRQSAALGALAQVHTVVFDKTGTLTATRIDAQQTICCADASWAPEQLLGLAAAAQSLVHHPIGAAFAPWAHLAPQGWQPTAARLLPGCGIEVSMMSPAGAETVRLGDPAQLLGVSNALGLNAAAALLARGHKPLALMLNTTCMALFALRDSPFVPPAFLMAELARRNIATEVLSGDEEMAVRALGVPEAQGALTAGQKLLRVRELQRVGSVCFVGDGLNDSAALAAADVAVSMQAGAELSVELADLTLPAGKPEAILAAIDVARSTTRLIRQNLIISVCYNTIGMTVAAAGLLNPVGAALLMAVSSLTVSARSLVMLAPLKDSGSTAPFGGATSNFASGRPDARRLAL